VAIISNATTIADAGAFSAGQGAMVLIKTLTASSSSTLSFVDGASSVVLDDTYPIYKFVFNNIHPANNGVTFSFQTSINTGSAYGVHTTSTYFNAYHNQGDSGAAIGYETTSDVAQSTGEIPLIREEKLSADNDHHGVGYLHLFNPASTTFVKNFISRTQANHAAEYSMDSYIAGYVNTTSAVDAIRFKVNSGNIDAGTITMYGIA
jgi:hypothetical protein